MSANNKPSNVSVKIVPVTDFCDECKQPVQSTRQHLVEVDKAHGIEKVLGKFCSVICVRAWAVKNGIKLP